MANPAANTIDLVSHPAYVAFQVIDIAAYSVLIIRQFEDETTLLTYTSLFDFYLRDDQLTERWLGGGVQTFLKEVADFFQQQGIIDRALDDYSATVDASFYKGAD